MQFNEIYYRTDKKALNLDGIEILRNAVRAVILDGNRILMAHLEKTDEYKFPGGGKKDEETTEEALKREVLEEVGFAVLKIIDKIGVITEYDIAKEGNNYYFKMISEYYLAEIEHKQLGQNLEKDEKELMFRPCWINTRKAYEINKSKINKKLYTTPGIYRETMALERIIEKYDL